MNNVMRHDYRPLNSAQVKSMIDMKNAGLCFYELCTALGTSRELHLAKTKIEEAVFWATKHITA
jgi:hypothetical protein